MKDSQAFIKWFWLELKKAHRLASYNDGLCQCESEHFIEGTDRPKVMRSFLILSVLIDQMMFTHFQSIYQEFRSHFCFPKLYSHPESGARMASPGWFIYSFHGFDKQMDWASALPVAHAVLRDLFDWLRRYPDGKQLLEKFKTLMEMEVRTEFETEASNKLLGVISQTRIFNGLGGANGNIIQKLTTPEECMQLAINVRETNPSLARDARRRAVELRAASHGFKSAVELELLKALYAYEEVLSEKNKRRTRATRTWQMINRHGIIGAAERAVNRKIEATGYKVLVAMGLHDLTFEAVIVRHPDNFSQEVVARAKERLGQLERI